MNNNTSKDIKVPNAAPSPLKRCFAVGQNIVFIIDKKIIQEIRINEVLVQQVIVALVQQELTKEGILLRPRRYVQ